MAKKEYTVEQIKEGKAHGMRVKDQMDAIKKSLKKEPDPIAFTDSFEDKLRERLFEQEIAEIQKEEEEKINNPDFERSGYTPKVNKKPGLWDYVREDEITFFDPSLSYELTGYRPINDKEGLDFDPTPFREAGMIFERTGAYCEFPKDCKPYIDFWNEQKRRCVEGYAVGKYRITGDHYFFLNFYRLPVTKEKDGMTFVEEGFPVFTTEHYKWFHYVEMCEYLKKDVAALKCRGVGWSEIAACLAVRPFITTRNYTSLYTAYAQPYLDGVLEKCWLQLNWLNHNTNYGMYRARGKIDNSMHKRATKVDKEGVEYGRFAEIIGLVADNDRKVRGFRCNRLFFEESGSYKNLSTAWVKGEALITRAGRRTGCRFAWGTGGDGDPQALEGLSKMFYNPDAYNILPYRHNHTEDGKDALTAFFLPAYAMVIDPELMDSRGYTDMVKARAYFEGERKKKSGQVLMDYCAEYCFTGEEALLKQGDNIFDSIAISDRLGQLRIQKIGVKPQQVKMYWDHPNEATNPRQKVKLVEDTANGKIFIYEPPQRDPEGNVYKNLYVAGIDAIDQGGNDSSGQKDVSDFCIVIKKRTFGSELPNYVAIYKDRPRDIVEAYENAMKLLVYYNCKAMLEHTKIGIIMYFRSKKKESLFMTRPKSTMSDIRRGNSNMLGVPATEIILKHGLELINQFLMECVYNVNIDSMLEQLLKYSWENKRKFDIVSAMIVAEIGDEDLMGFAPRIQNEVQKQWKDFGWYTDSYGRKRYGILPDNYGIRG